MRADPGSWDWRYRGTDLVRFDAVSGAIRSTHRILQGGDVLWGAAVLERDDHTYVFGDEDDPAGRVVVAPTGRC